MTTDTKASLFSLTTELYRFCTRAVGAENEAFFLRLQQELPFTLLRFSSDSEYNGWRVPQSWSVERAVIKRDGQVVFDGLTHPLAVATYSRSFSGELSLEDLRAHIVTDPERPNAYVFHCVWQYRPWAADWAFSIPYDVFKRFRPGRYAVELITRYAPGEMLVAEYCHVGSSAHSVVFNCHTCHPHQVNDGLAGVALLVRLLQWISTRKTYYSYRLILGPEHLGTVFYLSRLSRAERENLLCGIYTEMPGVRGPLRVAATFLGEQPLERALRNVLTHNGAEFVEVPWRRGAGNDETVWEAPGYEIPFVELTRCLNTWQPYPEYHTHLDDPQSLDWDRTAECLTLLQKTVEVLEQNCVLKRTFDGLICLSAPQYDLYPQRPDPALDGKLTEENERWGYLADCLQRYFDGRWSVLDIAEKHGLNFFDLYSYLQKFAEKGLVQMQFRPLQQRSVSPRLADREAAGA